jgi:DNA-binding transcriptional regulator LsrR (DeoR family)
MGTAEASRQLNVSARQVQRLAAKARSPGSVL